MAAPTIISGVADDSVILSNQKIIDMDNRIAQLEPDATPLTTMTMKLNKVSAKAQKHEWLEDQNIPRLTTLSVSAASGDTTISVSTGTGQYFRVRDTIRIASTGENVAVTAVSTDTLGVKRAIGSVTGLSAASGVDLVKLANAAAEGATLGTLQQTKKVAQFNYTQIVRQPWGFTNTALATSWYGGNLNDNEAKKKLIEHKYAIENMAFFGRRNLDTTAGAVTGYAGGITDYIATNITTASSGALTQATWEAFLQTLFRYGSREKVVFVSPIVYRALNSFPLAKLAPNDSGPGVKDYGVQLSSYQGGGTDGKVMIALKRDWDDFQRASPQLGGIAVAIDMQYVQWNPLINEGMNRDTKLLPNRQANDEDSAKQEYLTEGTFTWKLEQCHGLLRGVTAYS